MSETYLNLLIRISLHDFSTPESRAVAMSENPGGLVVLGGENLSPPG